MENPDRGKAIVIAHFLFDTLVMWIEEMHREMLRLEGENRGVEGGCGGDTGP